MASLRASAFAGAVTSGGNPITADMLQRQMHLQGVGDGRYIIVDSNGSVALSQPRGGEGRGGDPFGLNVDQYLSASRDPYADASPEMRGVIDSAKKLSANRSSADIPLLDDATKGLAKTVAAGIVKNFAVAEAEHRTQERQ